ncbi:hypothetical protein [Acidiphilium sp.]|uniref:hypothetical protein n=1 Tax=Acidiphilium sp. TaxID=527 RepID=UPI003CFDC5FA
MNDNFHDDPDRLDLPPARKPRKGIELLLSRVLLGFSVALIPALCFYLPGLLLGQAGETKSIALMLFAVTAAVVALFQSWRARLRWTADRPVGLVKTITVDWEVVASVPVRDLAALDLTLVEDPAIAVEQAVNLFRVVGRILLGIFIVAPVALLWEILILFAFGGLKLPLLHTAINGAQINALGDLARSFMAFDVLVVSFIAVIMLVTGKRANRRFGFRNIYRERRDGFLREQFSIACDEAITIASPSRHLTPARQRSF